ncbi:hypothetical protein ACA910_000304 [Epithemia clementina (nom. ined.)]
MTILIYEQHATTVPSFAATGLHPRVCKNVIKAQLDQHAVLFELSPAGDAHRDRLSLNRKSAQYVATFLLNTPRIKGLSIVSNIQPHDGAMEIMVNAFRTTQQIAILCLWGDGDDYDEVNSYYSNAGDTPPNTDDGSMLECLTYGLPDNSSVKSLRFHFYNFSCQHVNRIHLHRLFLQKRDFQRIIFSACNFGSLPAPGHISFLLEGLALQTELQELCIDTDDFEPKLHDEDLAAIINVVRYKGPSKRLHVLNLYDCGLGPKSLQALIAFLADRNCKVTELCLGGTRRLFRVHTDLRRQFLNTLCFSNQTVLRIHAGHSKKQIAFQRILELCVQRNKLVSYVEKVLCQQQSHHCCRHDLGLWGNALGSLAKHDGFVSSTAIYTALKVLAPQIAKHSSSSSSLLPAKRGFRP